jgi:hypothetical protein
MTTWHCDKCSLRFGSYADFGDHWRTDHRNDPITERAAERAKARQDAEKVILEAWQVIDHNCQAYKILSAALRSEEVQ